MKNPVDWQQIFLECKNNIQTNIKPCLKTLKEPQPNLGMGAGGDIMKPVDLAAETAIVDTLQQHDVSFTLNQRGVRHQRNSATHPEECYLTLTP